MWENTSGGKKRTQHLSVYPSAQGGREASFEIGAERDIIVDQGSREDRDAGSQAKAFRILYPVQTKTEGSPNNHEPAENGETLSAMLITNCEGG